MNVGKSVFWKGFPRGRHRKAELTHPASQAAPATGNWSTTQLGPHHAEAGSWAYGWAKSPDPVQREGRCYLTPKTGLLRAELHYCTRSTRPVSMRSLNRG